MIDIDVLRQIAKDNEAQVAKVKIQEYCKQHGFKMSKSNTSVKAMINKVIDHLDSIANGVGSTYTDSPAMLSFDDEPVNSTDNKITTKKLQSLDEVSQTEFKTKQIAVIGESSVDVIEIPILPEVTTVNMVSSIVQKTVETIEPKSTPIELISEKYTPHQTLIGRSHDAYMNVPYWVTDWITSVKGDWKTKISEFPEILDLKYLTDMIYYIKLNGKVIVRESRNSSFHHFY